MVKYIVVFCICFVLALQRPILSWSKGDQEEKEETKLHTKPFLYGKIYCSVFYLLRASIATSDTDMHGAKETRKRKKSLKSMTR